MSNSVRFRDPVVICPHACPVLICPSSDHQLPRRVTFKNSPIANLTELILKYIVIAGSHGIDFFAGDKFQ